MTRGLSGLVSAQAIVILIMIEIGIVTLTPAALTLGLRENYGSTGLWICRNEMGRQSAPQRCTSNLFNLDPSY
jgi:hypothetical protein